MRALRGYDHQASYRTRLNVSDARRLIATLGDGTFRPAIPRALLKVLGDYPPGVLVRLDNNEVGVVCGRPVRARGPFVKAIFGLGAIATAALLSGTPACWSTTFGLWKSPKSCHPWISA